MPFDTALWSHNNVDIHEIRPKRPNRMDDALSGARRAHFERLLHGIPFLNGDQMIEEKSSVNGKTKSLSSQVKSVVRIASG